MNKMLPPLTITAFKQGLRLVGYKQRRKPPVGMLVAGTFSNKTHRVTLYNDRTYYLTKLKEGR